MQNRFNSIIKHSWLRDSSQFKTYHEEKCYCVSWILYYKLPVPLHSLHTRGPKAMFYNLMKYISIKLYCSLHVIETNLNTISFYKYWLQERVTWGIVTPRKPMSTEAKQVRIYGELNTHKFFTVDIYLEYHPSSSNFTCCQVPSRVRAWFHDSAGYTDFYQMSLSQSESTVLIESIISIITYMLNSQYQVSESFEHIWNCSSFTYVFKKEDRNITHKL